MKAKTLIQKLPWARPMPGHWDIKGADLGAHSMESEGLGWKKVGNFGAQKKQ